MRVRSKLILIIVCVSLVPLVVSASTALRVHQRAVQEKLAEIHHGAADHAAARGNDYLQGVRESLELLAGRTIRWTALTETERQGALWLVYRQFKDATVVSLLDDAGHGLGSSAYVERSSVEPELGGHPVADEAVLRAFSNSLPFEDAKRIGFAVGTPFRVSGRESPFLPVAVAVDGGSGRKWVVAMAVSLRALCAELAPSGASPSIVIADQSGKWLCSSAPGLASDLGGPMLDMARDGHPELTRQFDSGGTEMVVAASALSTGWIVAASQPVEQAFVTSRQLEVQSVFWMAIALLAAIASGLILSGGITAPIRRLADGAKRLREGQLDHRLNLDRGDEFGELGGAFDEMSEGLAARDAEIRKWNEELQERVEARTAELTRAQQQLLASHKMAAVSTLAAGAAHEISNPLTSVLGVLQLQRAKATKFPERAGELKLLEGAESEAKRIKSIVSRLLELAQTQEQTSFKPVALEEVARSAVELLRADLEKKNLELVTEFRASKPVHGSFTQLQQAVVQVLRNAITASPEHGTINVNVTAVQDELVTLSVADDGPGIAAENLSKIFEPFFTTKQDWHGQGLGLAVAYRILQDHGGSIRAESTEGKGTTVVFAMPVGRKLAHLE